VVDTDVANPKLNISNIKSPLSGGGTELGKVGQGGTSKIGTLAKIVKKNRIKINSIEKSQEVQDEKITRIKDIIKTKQQNVGKKLPGSSDNIEKSLAETNKILVQIQKELMKSSSLMSGEGQSSKDRKKREKSKAKLNKEESQLEQSSRRIQKSVSEKSNEALAPVKGIFERIMDFVKTIALGIAVNAIFEWLKDPENMEKVKGWFSWIRENWGWAVAAVGAIAILPLVGVITGIVGAVGMMMPLFAMAIPFLAKALLIAGAAILAWKLMEAGFKAARNQLNGGTQFSAAHDVLDKRLKDAGLDNDGKKRGGGASWDFLGWAGTREELPMTKEEKQISADVLAKRKQLNSMRDDMRTEIRDKHSEMDGESGMSGMSTRESIRKHNKTKSEAEKEIRDTYSEKISQIVPINYEVENEGHEVEARARGGNIKAGTPYLVGEEGPELRVFASGGSIVSNPKTKEIMQKTYSNMTSRKRGRGGLNISTLPMQTNVVPPPEMPNMGVGEGATEVPDISSVDFTNPYRKLSAMHLGITV